MRSDVTIAYDAQRLASNLPAPTADLVPCASVHFIRTITQLPCQSNNLCNDEFSDTTGIAERGVEDGDAMLGRVLEVDLIRTDAKAADYF